MTTRRQIVPVSEHFLVPCQRERVERSKVELIAAAEVCRKRKVSIAGVFSATSISASEKVDANAESTLLPSTVARNEFESPSKKLKTEPNQPISSHEYLDAERSSKLNQELTEQTAKQFVAEVDSGSEAEKCRQLKMTQNDTSESIKSEANQDRDRTKTDGYNSLIGESHNDTYIRTVELESWVNRLTHETDSRRYHEEAVQGWRYNFLRKCADIVEVRFLNAIRVTCVKPFYEKFTSCWRTPDSGATLEESTLAIHQEFQTTATETSDLRDDFSEHEIVTLVRNFFQISRTYSLKHPYLVASIQTGLETRKDLFDFNKFRVDHHIVAKLCVNLQKRSALSCILQLRLILAPRALPFDRFISETIVAHLFAGFGPDWVTISKLTGFNQFSLKTTIALLHNIDASAVSPQLWFQIHQKMLDDKKFAPEAPMRQKLPTTAAAAAAAGLSRFRQAFPSSCRNLRQLDCVGDLISFSRKLPPFESLTSPWKTIVNAADVATNSVE